MYQIENGRATRIARAICSKKEINIDSDVLDFCRETLSGTAKAKGFENAKEVVHGGPSVDGYISFTEGDVAVLIPIDGYELLEISDGRYFPDWQEACMENFWIENHGLTDGVLVDGVGRIDNLPYKKLAELLKDGLLGDEIEEEYSKYENHWMLQMYGYLAVEVQFRNDGKGANPENYTAVVYSYVCDEYMRQKKFLFQDSFVLNEYGEDFRSTIKGRIESAFEAAKK